MTLFSLLPHKLFVYLIDFLQVGYYSSCSFLFTDLQDAMFWLSTVCRVQQATACFTQGSLYMIYAGSADRFAGLLHPKSFPLHSLLG